MKVFKISILIVVLINFASCQLNSLTPVKLALPTDCISNTQYFDISSSECKECPQNSIKKDRKYFFIIRIKS